MSQKKLWDGTNEFYAHTEDWGFNEPTRSTLTRLFQYIIGLRELEDFELKRWKKLKIIDAKGRVGIEDFTSGMEWCLFGLCWEGIVQRAWVRAK